MRTWKIVAVAAVVLALISGGLVVFRGKGGTGRVATSVPPRDSETTESGPEDEYESAVPPAVTVTPAETQTTAAEPGASGGFDILIADRGNNRIVEVTPDKKIVWEYDFALPRPGLGADDAFFADGGKSIVAGLEEWQVIEVIDVATKKVTWRYGMPGVRGSKAGQLHTPDDPYKLPNGDITVADISNCRIIQIAPDKSIVRQYGTTGVCGHGPGLLDKPNSDTPLPNGHTLVSNIVGHVLTELDEGWKPVFTMTLPLQYPSDPQLTKAGNILVAGYTDPGKIIEVAKDGTIVWRQDATDGPLRLKRPSLAIELPNGNVLTNDDENHRVIIIDKAAHRILWQYGVNGKPGRGPGQLNVPDGVDIIDRNLVALPPPDASVPLGVGKVSRHIKDFLGQDVRIAGYVRRAENGMVIVSDEKGGAVGYYDFPVKIEGSWTLPMSEKYAFSGIVKEGDKPASNGNPGYLESAGIPELINP